MIDLSRWLPGLAPDEPEEEESAVSKTLRALGQVPEALGDIGRAAGQSVVGSAQSAGQAVSDAYAVPPEERPPLYSGPSYAQPTREQAGLPEIGVTEPIEQIGRTLAEAGRATVEAADRTLTGPTVSAPTWEDPLAPVREVGQHVRENPLSVLPAAIYGDIQGAGTDVIGRRAAEGAGVSDVKQPYQTPLGTFEVSGQDVAGLAAQLALDPLNVIGTGPTARAGRAAVEAAAPVVREGAEAAGRAAGRIGSALAENATLTAAADARMAAQGSTTAPAVFGALPEPGGARRGLPTVEVITDQLDTATAAWRRASEAGDDQMASIARARAIELESALVDARNARLDLEPAITSDVGRRVNPLTLTEESADDLTGSMRTQEAVRGTSSDLSGPVGVPVDMSGRANASAGAAPRIPGSGALPAVNRALSEGLAGGFGGAVIEQGRNPDEDPRTAAARGFAAGAVGFPIATRAARGAARLAGAAPSPGGGADAAAYGVLGALPGGTKAAARWQQATQKAAAQAAAAQAAGLAPPPTAGDWLRSVGYSAMIGPSTGIVNAVGNGMELAYHLPKDLGRAIMRGRPGEAAVEGRAILTGFLRSGGEMLEALAGAHPGGGVETARLSQRATSPMGRVAAGLLEAPTRLFSEVPDAFYRTIAESMGEARAAAQSASDAGLSGTAWKQHVADLLEDAKQVRAGQLPAHADTQRVLDEAGQLAERLTLRGDIGPRGQAFKKGIDALPFGLGNLVMPFFNTPYQMTQRLLERTPAGLKMGTQPARYDKAYDALVGSSIGAGAAGLAAAGLISGSGPEDPNQRKLLQSQGWQNNSTLINGVWLPNNALGVFGPMFDAAGELGDAMRYQKKDATGRDLGGDLVRRASKVAQNQVYLKGVAELLKAMENPAQFGESFAASTLGRAIPLGATARTFATAEDPLERRPEPGKGVGFLENVQQRIARGLPEFAAPLPGISSRQELPADQDVLGRPVENPRAGAAALGPRTRTPQSDPVLERFEAAGVTIGPPRDAITEDGQTVDLTPAETRRWNELRGERIIGATQRLIESGALDRMPPERRAERLEEIKTDAAERATEAVRREIGSAEFRRRRKAAA